MKISGPRLVSFLEKPRPSLRAALFYGPDQGLVREQADKMAQAVVDDPLDPFRISHLNAAILKDNPERLIDEAAALSMSHGARIVRIQGANDSLVPLFTTLFNSDAQLSLVIAEAGVLPPQSPLRHLFEENDEAVAAGCYLDDDRALENLIHETCDTYNLTITPDAKRYLIDNLGSNRLVSRRELEKLVLYVGTSHQITEVDTAAVVGDNGENTINILAVAIADGNSQQAIRSLTRLRLEGISETQALRGTLRHLHKLHAVVAFIAAGDNITQAVRRLRPPVHFSIRDTFHKQAAAWPPRKLQRAMNLLLDAEDTCKRQGRLAPLITLMVVLRIAHAAQKLKSG